jgi:hypothetical protein
VVDAQAVVVVDLVADLLVGTVRDYAEVQETRQLLHQFKLEGALADVCGLEDAAEVLAGLDVAEDGL